ncbi:hypothetical protein [Nocardiopsis coralliicola]
MTPASGPAGASRPGAGGDGGSASSAAAHAGASRRAAYARIEGQSEAALGAALLAGIPLHSGQPPGTVHRWADRAVEFGRGLAQDPVPAAAAAAQVVHRATGGVTAGEILLAEYLNRAGGDRIVVYGDALDFAHRVAAEAGWRADYPPAAIRAAALAHEEAHRLLHAGRQRTLRRRLGHDLVRLGPLRLRGHVAGAGEIAAHAYAGARCGLTRSPLALTAAIAAALAHPDPAPAAPGAEPPSRGTP